MLRSTLDMEGLQRLESSLAAVWVRALKERASLKLEVVRNTVASVSFLSASLCVLTVLSVLVQTYSIID